MRRWWLIFAQATTVALAVLFVLSTLRPQWLPRTLRQPVAPARPPLVALPPATPPAIATAGPGAPAIHEGFAPAARRASPAVVSVTTSLARRRRGGNAWDDPRAPADESLAGFGSGVIVSDDGVLLTNHHVVQGAGDIEVRLVDGRSARAQLLGTDPETDLAVLKIELPNVPAVELGDSAALQVGDAVLAIGNPFNVGQTVTSGIVSALGRNGLGLSTFESFIQTDAAINPGNSGGALVDAQGRLIGINTAIYSRTGGSNGIGFAIPIELARRVMDDLLRDGQVRRGWIGVELRELTPGFIESFKLPVDAGVLITGVLRDGPADKAGLRPGDVVTKVADQPVASLQQLRLTIAALPPGKRARLALQRGGQRMDVEVDVVQREPTEPRLPRP